MKTIAMFLPLLIVFLLNTRAQSQERLQKGNFFVGGGFGLSLKDDSDDYDPTLTYNTESSSFSISPYAGKFIKDKLAIGIGTGFSRSSSTSETLNNGDRRTNENSVRGVSANIFLKKFWSIGESEKFGVYLQPSLGYAYHKSEEELIDNINDFNNFTRKEKADLISLGTKLGLYYFISPRFSLETTLANLTFSKRFSENQHTSNASGSHSVRNSDSDSLNFNFINTFTFDKIIVINFYF